MTLEPHHLESILQRYLAGEISAEVVEDSHPGKLQAFKDTVNHACHDNAPPGTAAMTQACGEINFLQKEYLAR